MTTSYAIGLTIAGAVLFIVGLTQAQIVVIGIGAVLGAIGVYLLTKG